MENIYNFNDFINESKKENPNAKVRNRGDVVFSAENPKVKDNKDHFPINSEKQARNALARINQYDKTPEWYDGELKEMIKKVVSRIESKYPSIDTSEKSKNPGKD